MKGVFYFGLLNANRTARAILYYQLGNLSEKIEQGTFMFDKQEKSNPIKWKCSISFCGNDAAKINSLVEFTSSRAIHYYEIICVSQIRHVYDALDTSLIKARNSTRTVLIQISCCFRRNKCADISSSRADATSGHGNDFCFWPVLSPLFLSARHPAAIELDLSRHYQASLENGEIPLGKCSRRGWNEYLENQ